MLSGYTCVKLFVTAIAGMPKGCVVGTRGDTYRKFWQAFMKGQSSHFPGGRVVKTMLPVQGAQVQSLVGELRSLMLQGLVKQRKDTS